MNQHCPKHNGTLKCLVYHPDGICPGYPDNAICTCKQNAHFQGSSGIISPLPLEQNIPSHCVICHLDYVGTHWNCGDNKIIGTCQKCALGGIATSKPNFCPHCGHKL